VGWPTGDGFITGIIWGWSRFRSSGGRRYRCILLCRLKLGFIIYARPFFDGNSDSARRWGVKAFRLRFSRVALSAACGWGFSDWGIGLFERDGRAPLIGFLVASLGLFSENLFSR
jgi:hypothetical protein